MVAADVPDAVRAWRDADIAMRAQFHLPVPVWDDAAVARTERRISYFLGTDPGGSFVAEVDGAVVGLAQVHRREGLWVLAHLFVSPSAQNQGAGRALIDRALAYGDSGEPGLIISSRDPRAIRRYAHAGFGLWPAVVGWGVVRPAGLGAAPLVREGSDADLELTAVVDRQVRGAARPAELALFLAEGDRLLVVDRRGYALLRGPRVAIVSALDEDAAVQLLTAGLAEASDTEYAETARITAPQQWAVGVALAAGLELHPHGPVMVRGTPGPLQPYLPDGALG
jgi:GNAT superfamily N-acetyltransferase